MRVSTSHLVSQNIAQMSRLSTQIADTQRQLSTGRRVNLPSDDPLGAANILRLEEQLSQRETYLDNINAADRQLGLEENTLERVEEILQVVTELTVQAGAVGLNSVDRGSIATAVSVRLQELRNLVNIRGDDGKYLFSGYAGDTEPFNERLEFVGTAGSRELDIDRGARVTVSDSGRRVFAEVPASEPSFVVKVAGDELQAGLGLVTDPDALQAFYPEDIAIRFEDSGAGLTYSVVRRSDQRPLEGRVDVPYGGAEVVNVAGMQVRLSGPASDGDQVILETTDTQSTLLTIERLAQGLQDIDEPSQPESFRRLIDGTLTDLASARDRVSEVRSEIGARLNAVDNRRSLHQDLILRGQSALSEIRDVDYAAAVSRLASESFVLEAAQQSFLRVSRLSLFERL